MLSGVSRADEPVYDIDIPSMNAAEALNRFAEQTGAIMLFPYDLASTRRANAVRGRYTLLKALDLLLQNTGLSGGLSDKRVVNISLAGNEKRLAEEGSMPKQNVSLGKRITAFVASIFSVSAASGQETDTGAQRIEEVIVTAQKREERLIDTPQSVSVLSSDDLAKLSATQFRDFADTVPGLSFATAGAGNTQVTLRGVSVGGDVSPAVGIYVDEVPYGPTGVFNLGPQFALDAALFDLDRIEILRGPQGTLYGASTMGGLIKYVSKRPQMESFGSTAQAGVASTKDGGVSYNVAAMINAPIVSDKAALRASGFQFHDGGYIDNLAQDREDVNRSDMYGARVDFLLTPSDARSIRLNGFLQNISRDGEGTADYTFAGTEPNGVLGQSRPFNEPFDQRFRLVSGTVSYDMTGASLISISSFQTMKSDFVLDLSALFAPLLGLGAVGLPGESTTDKFTQEVRLASRDGARPVEWVLGVFYTHEKSGLDEEFALRDLAGNPTPNTLFTYSVPSRYEEYAAFGDLTWHLNDKFDVTGGLRYARNDQEKSQSGSGALGLSHPTLRSIDDVVTYLANARYRFTDRAVGYLRYATGYRPGGPNIVTVAGGSPTFEADRLKSYEAGLKAESADGRFGVDVAVYDIDWSNIQIPINVGGFQTVANGPAAEIRGAELKLQARPVPAFTVSTALTYTDAQLAEADDDLGGAKGERLPITPRVTATLSGDYEVALASTRPTLGATVRHVSDRTISFDQSPSIPQYSLPEYTTVDLRAGLTFGTISTQLYVRNLLDEHGQLSILFPQFGARVAIMQPRTFGVSVSTTF